MDNLKVHKLESFVGPIFFKLAVLKNLNLKNILFGQFKEVAIVPRILSTS
jgi:hypothetical protein